MVKENKCKCNKSLLILAIIAIIAIVAIVAISKGSSSAYKGHSGSCSLADKKMAYMADFETKEDMKKDFKEYVEEDMKESEGPMMEEKETKDLLGKATSASSSKIGSPAIQTYQKTCTGNEDCAIRLSSPNPVEEWGFEIYMVYKYNDGTSKEVCGDQNGGACTIPHDNPYIWKDMSETRNNWINVSLDIDSDKLTQINIWSVAWHKVNGKWESSEWSQKASVNVVVSKYKSAEWRCKSIWSWWCNDDGYEGEINYSGCRTKSKWYEVADVLCSGFVSRLTVSDKC